MKKTILLPYSFVSLAFLLLSFSVLAQQHVINGVVRDGKNNPLEGATVLVKNDKKNTLTKANGKFELTVPDGKTVLNISFVGYETKSITVGALETNVLVTLSESATNQLNDVVIVGVQKQSKRTTTSAISTVLSKEIENLPAPSVDQLLQGRVAGLNVQVTSGEPGTAPTIVVRGNNRVSTSIGNDPNIAQAHALSGPLYVIDGIPTNPEDISNGIDATGTNYLAGININDIESVDVQKDATATAAWGSRGANGVVYIKTKRGRSLTPEFRVNVYGGVTEQPQLLPTSTGAAERAQKLDIINKYATPAQLANLPQILTDRFNPSFNNATDWQGLFYRPGSIQNVDATVSAAGSNVNYRLSMNYYDEKGIIERFGFKRYSLRGNFDFKISPRLNSQFIVGISKSDRQRGRKYYGNSDDNTPVSGSSQPSSLYRLTAFDSSNFIGGYTKLRNKNINDYYSASLTVNYDVLPSLKYTFQGGANISTTARDYFQPSNIDEVAALNPDSDPQPSFARSDKGTYSTYFVSNTLNFLKRISTKNGHDHNFAVTGSQQFNTDVSNSNYVQGYNIPSNDIQVVSGVPQSDLSGGSDYQSYAMLSLLGQVQYDYDRKYLLYGSYRRDASSRFGEKSKWGSFSAAGAGWIISEEKFMDKIKGVIPYLKVRGTYGVSGDQSPYFYAPFNSYTIPGTYNGSAAIQPSYTNGLTKNNLTWTRTIQKDIGLDAQLFNNRITLAVDLYDKLAKDGYFDFNLPFFTGFQSINFNAHDLWISNRGVDITLSTKNLSSKSPLQWNMQITISHNKNLIAKLPNNNRTFALDDWYGISRIYSVGQPIYEMFQLKYMGVYNRQEDIPFNQLTGNPITYFKGNHKVVPGDPIWQDVNNIGDVWPDEDNGAAYGDRIPTGDPNPQFTGGWVNDFSYKNFSLSILSIFTWKRTVVNTFFQQQISNIAGGYSSSLSTFANSRLPDLSNINYWTPQKIKDDPNFKANFPSINPFDASYYQYIPISSMFNEDGSYFKVKNIVLGYQLPHVWIEKAKLKGARVYGIVDNVLTLKKGTMPNPELVDELGVYTGGLYPTPTKFTFGLDVTF
ncbi:MAG: SusC/RagA family TonB-linked outer membrane protein [Ginsengibacter sp.]